MRSKTISGYDGQYEVTESGQVWSYKYGKRRLLKQCGVYKYVNLYKNGNMHTQYVHHLVLNAFIGPKPSKRHESNHKNGKKHDNHWTNLEWLTPKENSEHAWRTGLAKANKGEKHGRAKLTEDKVRKIRKMHATHKYTMKHLGEQFGVSSSVISGAVRRITWSYLR